MGLIKNANGCIDYLNAITMKEVGIAQFIIRF